VWLFFFWKIKITKPFVPSVPHSITEENKQQK